MPGQSEPAGVGWGSRQIEEATCVITIMILIFTEHLLRARHHAQHSYSSSHSLFVQESRSARAHGTFWENCKEFSMAGTDHVEQLVQALLDTLNADRDESSRFKCPTRSSKLSKQPRCLESAQLFFFFLFDLCFSLYGILTSQLYLQLKLMSS